MAVQGARVNVTGSKKLKRLLRDLDPRVRDGVTDEVMRDLGKLVKANAQETQIVRGRGDAPPLPRQLSYRTGHLTRSIGTDFSEAPRRYIVGTPVAYGTVHELGLPPYPKRPFLEPAVEYVIEQKAERLFRLAMQRAGR